MCCGMVCVHICNLVHILFGSQAPSLSGSQTTPADSGTVEGGLGSKLQRRGGGGGGGGGPEAWQVY